MPWPRSLEFAAADQSHLRRTSSCPDTPAQGDAPARNASISRIPCAALGHVSPAYPSRAFAASSRLRAGSLFSSARASANRTSPRSSALDLAPSRMRSARDSGITAAFACPASSCACPCPRAPPRPRRRPDRAAADPWPAPRPPAPAHPRSPSSPAAPWRRRAFPAPRPDARRAAPCARSRGPAARAPAPPPCLPAAGA